MTNKKIISLGLLHTAFTVLYIIMVAGIIFSIERLGNVSVTPLIGFSLFLSLFVVSAAIVMSLIFLRPLLWYLDNHKKEALKLLLTTIAGLLIFTILGIATLEIFFYMR